MKSQSDKKDPKLAAKESDFSFIQKFAQFLFSKKYKKKEFLLRAGEINDRIFYVKKGLLRVYMVYEEKEINTWFVKENEFISSVNSYYNETPSEEFIQALEDSEIISFKKSTYSMVLKHNHKLALFAIKQLYIKLCEYSDQCQYLRILSAEKKYEFLKKKNPEVLERVSQKHVASFLGIETTYLNKIIASHKE
ncbi:Crp/Fnr family transcriptional regulator [Flavobacterium ammonificans]|uniref:cAMP-binding protein n=1 Tax=Flavobacterium ammonificans TaxID=1751056 RepID=A0ABM7UXY7_9FLAO|nr:Crp/Fnr family transcriptional regulator [Flavobacterium ammonificans]BDB52334.1 cAMP-binding protein [Flavobacterium ammonificans]